MKGWEGEETFAEGCEKARGVLVSTGVSKGMQVKGQTAVLLFKVCKTFMTPSVGGVSAGGVVKQTLCPWALGGGYFVVIKVGWTRGGGGLFSDNMLKQVRTYCVTDLQACRTSCVKNE